MRGALLLALLLGCGSNIAASYTARVDWRVTEPCALGLTAPPAHRWVAVGYGGAERFCAVLDVGSQVDVFVDAADRLLGLETLP